MNILLNASNLRHGGGRTVALQLINAVAPLRTADKLYVLAPKEAAYEALAAQHPNVSLLHIPEQFHRNWLHKLWHIHRVFPKWCDRLAVDKVVSLGNVAFYTRKRPQLLYIQLPLLAYHESPAWKTMDMKAFLRNSLMDQYVAMHMRYATAYAVQTKVMQRRFAERFKLDEATISILPNAAIDNGEAGQAAFPEPRLPLRLLFLSRYYPHKHFECLPELARLIQERNIPVEITLTIDRREGSGAAAVLHAVRKYPCIRNIGPVPLNDVGATVAAHHGIFLPSLMESFSGAYAEALQHRRLIFTSHFDFAVEMLGEAAFYFDPLKPEQIASVLETAVTNPVLVDEKRALIAKAAEVAPQIKDVALTFSRIIDTFA